MSAYLPAYVSKELSLLKLPASKSSLTSNPPSSVTDVARRDAVMAAIKRGFATLDADILKGGFVDTTHDIVNENDDGVSAVLRPAVGTVRSLKC